MTPLSDGDSFQVNLPYFVISQKGEICHTNRYGEQLLIELYNCDINNPGLFFLELLEKRQFVFKSQPNIYGIKLLESREKTELLIINLNEFERGVSDMMDVSSLLHELKTPLTIIDGTAQLMAGKTTDDFTRHCADMIKKECGRIGSLLENIRFLSELSLTLAPFNPIKMIEDICNSARVLFPEITFRLEIEPSLNTIVADRDKLFLALFNIVKNACEAQKSGDIRISLAPDPTIKVFNKEKNRLSSMVKFSIIDSGKGISEKVYEKIFTPFFTTKSKGSGLGLVITKEIIEKHHGRIEVISRESVGTAFTILLPQ